MSCKLNSTSIYGHFELLYFRNPKITLVDGLVLGSDGNFYGTTELGGQGYTGPMAGVEHPIFQTYGTVFRIGANGSFTSLFSFNRTNGASPVAELVEGKSGTFYGTTSAGGPHDAGTIFRLSVPAEQ